jgi:hypothetical protein
MNDKQDNGKTRPAMEGEPLPQAGDALRGRRG